MNIELLDKVKHIRSQFQNQHQSLQNFIRDVATRDADAGMSRCFVLTDGDSTVRGYYTLSGISIDTSGWDDQFKKANGLKYTTIPCTLLGKLAVNHADQGKSYGKLLLFDALANAAKASKKVGSALIIVDPIDEAAAKFYQKYDFNTLANTHRMFLSMKKVVAVLA
jgi:hypothetical protein